MSKQLSFSDCAVSGGHILLDLHAHSSGISRCCRIPADEVVKRATEHGIGGIVLTNHYQRLYIESDGISALVERYIREYEAAKQHGESAGCRVFFGIEVTMERYPNVHMLIYGVRPDFLRENPLLFDDTQEQLYARVKAAGGLLVQAHPFRNHTTVLDPRFLDGVEINCHPLYGNAYTQELLQIAQKHRLLLTCGGDYHADTYRPQCGMLVPDEVRDGLALGRWLHAAGEARLRVHEVNGSIHEISYCVPDTKA